MSPDGHGLGALWRRTNRTLFFNFCLHFLNGFLQMALLSKMPYDNGPMILGVTWMEAGLAVIAVALRLFARVRRTKSLGIEDWAMLLAMVRLYFSLIFNAVWLCSHSAVRFWRICPATESVRFFQELV